MMKNSLVAVFIVISLTGCNSEVKEKPVSSAGTVRTIDRIKLTDLEGQPVSLKQYAGKTIFLNFWATWCRPCVEEMPSIQEVQDLLKNKDIIFFLASAESAEQIKEFSAGHAYKFSYVRVENIEEMNVQILPTTFIFSPDGENVFSAPGSRKWDEKNIIDTILKIVNTK